ncbi:hypothetical protein KC717_01615 [Candidatus Dojkabacteria bacterium]|uniref:Uncharacterized protein n=1 Tax=Candidatus Dojkabacteria bacterium TaxID=2099670 RepID=A0A955L7D2_9BACT|nr:hypothetical protein [Candidatus Dojkabacteria bacterium]
MAIEHIQEGVKYFLNLELKVYKDHDHYYKNPKIFEKMASDVVGFVSF